MQKRKENIVLGAWKMMTEFASLKKLNFFPSFIGMTWLLIILLYQLTFAYIIIFQKKDEALEAFGQFIHTNLFVEVVIALVIIFILFNTLEPIATGGLIEMMSSYKQHNGKKNRRSWQGFFDGLAHFLPLFELHNLTAIFRPVPIITSYIFILRIFGMEFFGLITSIMIVYLFFAFFINLCFSYSTFFVVFEGKGALESLSASTGMAIRNIGITSRLYFTSLLLYLRTILVGAMFLVIPFLISGTIAFVGVLGLKLLFLVVFLIVSVIFFIFIVHLNSSLEIFVLATWFEAYHLCTKEDALLHDNKNNDDIHNPS